MQRNESKTDSSTLEQTVKVQDVGQVLCSLLRASAQLSERQPRMGGLLCSGDHTLEHVTLQLQTQLARPETYARPECIQYSVE